MKKLALLVTLSILLFMGSYSVIGAQDTGSMPATPTPTLLQVVGTTDAFLGATIYPKFRVPTNSSGQLMTDNPQCAAYLEKPYTDGGFSLAPLWVKSKFGNGKTTLKNDPGWRVTPGLAKVDFQIPERFSNTSKILFTWTVRVEGTSPTAYNPWPILCKPWHGTCNQEFPDGQVHTQLYINDRPYGKVASLTIPGGGSLSKRTVSDPTLTGSCLISKDDFGGVFPAKMKIEIRWYNATSLQIKSPKEMRSLIITVVPITTQQR